MQQKQSGNIKNRKNVGSKWHESTEENSWQNIDRIRSQPISEFCGIIPINEWVERRRRELDEHITRMDAERFGKTQGTMYLPE